MSGSQTRPFIRALLIDVSGNLHVGTAPTPDAVGALLRLRASGIPFRLCSNTSKESTQSLVKRLNNLGFGIRQPLDLSEPAVNLAGPLRYHQDQCDRRYVKQEVWTSIGALAHHIRNEGLKRPFLLLSPSAKQEIMRSSCIHDPPEQLVESPVYDSVVVGLAPELLDYAHLNTAFRILKGEHKRPRDKRGSSSKRNDDEKDEEVTPPKFIVTHKAKYIQTENPFGLSLGPGPFVLALETAAGVKAHVIGKPTQLFFKTVIDDFYATGELEQIKDRGRIAVVGDDVEADLGEGAVEMGLWRILVKTGKYRAGDESRPGVVPPDEVFDSFAAFVNSLLITQVSNPRSNKL